MQSNSHLLSLIIIIRIMYIITYNWPSMCPCPCPCVCVCVCFCVCVFMEKFDWHLKHAIRENCRFQWPRVLRHRSSAARLLRLRVRIPPGAWMSVCCECCVLSGRGLCDELITRPEESYRLWCVVECDLETWLMRRPWPTGGRCARKK